MSKKSTIDEFPDEEDVDFHAFYKARDGRVLRGSPYLHKHRFKFKLRPCDPPAENKAPKKTLRNSPVGKEAPKKSEQEEAPPKATAKVAPKPVEKKPATEKADNANSPANSVVLPDA